MFQRKPKWQNATSKDILSKSDMRGSAAVFRVDGAVYFPCKKHQVHVASAYLMFNYNVFYKFKRSLTRVRFNILPCFLLF